jgi:hypothetical protein
MSAATKTVQFTEAELLIVQAALGDYMAKELRGQIRFTATPEEKAESEQNWRLADRIYRKTVLA